MTLDKTQKADIKLFAMDMFEGHRNAVRSDPELGHAAIVHDPFHVMKQSIAAVDEFAVGCSFVLAPSCERLVEVNDGYSYARGYVCHPNNATTSGASCRPIER